MDFNVKKLVKEAGTALSRVVQLTEEKLGTSEKTELDAQFENLAQRSDSTKQWTEKLVKDTEAVLTPNPGKRVESYIFDKIEKKKPNRLSNLEYLGLDMIEAGNEFGAETVYGKHLIKIGETEQSLGQCERDFIATAGLCYIQPLRRFLDGDMKTVIKERGILESKRLDLDACKSRVRKARSLIGKQTAERDVGVAQSEFHRQEEITKLLLEGVVNSSTVHLRHLHDLVHTQVRHHAKSYNILQQLERTLASINSPIPYTAVEYKENLSSPEIDNKIYRARVMYNYELDDSPEIKLMENDVISVAEYAVPNDEYMVVLTTAQKFRVPRSFLEIIHDTE